jgi:hypothetical protein
VSHASPKPSPSAFCCLDLRPAGNCPLVADAVAVAVVGNTRDVSVLAVAITALRSAYCGFVTTVPLTGGEPFRSFSNSPAATHCSQAVVEHGDRGA